MRVASEEQRIAELEEKIEELEATVESLRETVETQQEAFERLVRDWLQVTEHLGLEPHSHALHSSYRTSTTDKGTEGAGCQPASASAPISASASSRPGCAEVDNPPESAESVTVPVDVGPSAATTTVVGEPVPSSATPGVILIPPTPQTSQEVAAYEKVPLVNPAGDRVLDTVGDGVRETPGDGVQELPREVRLGDQVEARADADADGDRVRDAGGFEPSLPADAKAAESEPAAQIFQPVQLLAPPSNAEPSSPVPRSRSRSRARLSPIPIDQLRRSPRLRSLSPGMVSSPLTSTPNSPTPMPRSPAQFAAKRALAEDSENDSSSKRARIA
jgi:uncharacterized coiled-coil protein SlyX